MKTETLATNGGAGRDRSWSPAQLKKFKATMAAKKKRSDPQKKSLKLAVKAKKFYRANPKIAAQHDTIIYLRHARKEIRGMMIRGHKGVPDAAHLYALLALRTLQGDE